MLLGLDRKTTRPVSIINKFKRYGSFSTKDGSGGDRESIIDSLPRGSFDLTKGCRDPLL